MFKGLGERERGREASENASTCEHGIGVRVWDQVKVPQVQRRVEQCKKVGLQLFREVEEGKSRKSELSR